MLKSKKNERHNVKSIFNVENNKIANKLNVKWENKNKDNTNIHTHKGRERDTNEKKKDSIIDKLQSPVLFFIHKPTIMRFYAMTIALSLDSKIHTHNG